MKSSLCDRVQIMTNGHVGQLLTIQSAPTATVLNGLKFFLEKTSYLYTTTWWWHRRRHPGSTRGASWVLPRKVAEMVCISIQFRIWWVLPGCFLPCTSSSRRKHPESSHHNILMALNSHQIGKISRKHPWVPPGWFLLWHHQQVIDFSRDLSFDCFMKT